MTQEEKELLLKDLSARLPYGVQVEIEGYHIGILKGIDGRTVTTDRGINYPLRCVKPYLRPISNITEEEAKDIATLMGIKDIISINITEKYIDVIKDDGFCSTETITIWFNKIVSSIEIFDYLNSHYFDFRGLIRKCLAAPMYNT